MLVCACNFLELIFPLSPSILSNILPASSEETKQKSVVTIEKTSNFQKWSKQNWDLITDFLIHIWGWYWWLHMQKLLLSSLLKFFSKFQQNVMSILLLCKKIQTFFCNYFSMCTLFWIDLQKTQKKLLIYVLFIPIFDFWYFGPFSCVIFPPFLHLGHPALQNVNKDYVIFSYYLNFVAQSDQKWKMGWRKH